MAEIFFTNAEQRVFNVFIEDVERLSNFDTVAEVGSFAAIVKEFTQSVTDGFVTIHFVSVTDNALISGIEVFAD